MCSESAFIALLTLQASSNGLLGIGTTASIAVIAATGAALLLIITTVVIILVVRHRRNRD